MVRVLGLQKWASNAQLFPTAKKLQDTAKIALHALVRAHSPASMEFTICAPYREWRIGRPSLYHAHPLRHRWSILTDRHAFLTHCLLRRTRMREYRAAFCTEISEIDCTRIGPRAAGTTRRPNKTRIIDERVFGIQKIAKSKLSSPLALREEKRVRSFLTT